MDKRNKEELTDMLELKEAADYLARANQSINQSIYLFVLCFKTKNTPIYVKKSFQKHRKAAK